MKEFLPQIPKKKDDQQSSKTSAVLAGILALGLSHSADAQTNNKENQNNTDNVSNYQKNDRVSKHEDAIPYQDTILPKFDLQKIYNENKKVNDEHFNFVFQLQNVSDNQTAYVEYKGVKNVKIRIDTQETDTTKSQEKFTNLEDLGKKYPNYRTEADALFLKYYNEYIEETSWNKILQEKESTLANNFEHYTPTKIELDIMAEEVKKHDDGGVTDGFDSIYHYYEDKLESPKDRYLFYMNYNCTPMELGLYMQKKYYMSFVKN